MISITDIISTLGYPGLVLVMALENVFPPIPSEVVMPFAGFLITKGKFNLILTILSGVLGSVIGAIILYLVGALFSGKKVREFLRRYGKYLMVSETDLDTGERYFNRYGEWAVLLARVIPIVRSIISIPAGFIKMPMGKFLVLTVLGTSVWTSLLTFLGVILGESWPMLAPYFHKCDVLVAIIIITTAGYALISRIKRG